ncbi:MAG: HNH endonuclease [Demequina sp.]|nr:HNH endonuclease [Demequina sp.]
MTFSLTDVDARTAPLREFEGVDLPSLPRAELVGLLRVAGDAKGAMDRLMASVAGEVARRSTAEDGAGGLARQHGFASPQRMVAAAVGAAPSEGFKLVTAGTLMSQDRPLATALGDGLPVGKADLIASTLATLDGDTDALEAKLTRVARHQDYQTLKLICSREAAKFDAAHQESVERRHYEQRSVEVTQETSGRVTIRGTLPATQGAILITYLEAQVKAAYQAKRDSDETGTVDARTAPQIRADALTALVAHGLDCDSPATGVKATIILRVDADQLRADAAGEDAGLATCDALTTPISLTALKELAIDATIARMVVDAKSHVLDFGHDQRLFTWAQRMALAERDGGCAKCHAPISHCIAHHIRWWHRDAGPTDISNGVLLCVRCHTQIHRDGWSIDVDENNHVWFTPPRELDPEQRRILGGLAALTV